MNAAPPYDASQCGSLGTPNVRSVNLTIANLSDTFVKAFNGVSYALPAVASIVNGFPSYVSTSPLPTYLGCASSTIFFNSNAAVSSWVVGSPTSACMSKLAVLELSPTTGALLMKTPSWTTVGSFGVLCGSVSSTATGEYG